MSADASNATAAPLPPSAGSGLALLPGVVIAVGIFSDYVLIVIGLLGVLNNAVAALVFSVYYAKFPPSCLYFLVLSVSDFFSVWFLCIFQWAANALESASMRPFDAFTQSLGVCRVMRYLQMICTSLGAYVMVVLSFERAACLLAPVRLISFFTVRRRVAMVIAVALAAAVLWTQVFVTFELRPRYVNGSVLGCYPSLQLTVQYSLAFNYQMIFVNYTVPALLILAGNLLALFGYQLNRMNHRQLAATQRSDKRTSGVESDVKVTMVMLSLQYLVLNLPYSVSWPLFSILKFYGYETSSPSLFYNVSNLNFIFMVVAYGNLSINLYFYLFKVRRFKRYLMRLICCRCFGRLSSGPDPLGSSSAGNPRQKNLTGSAAVTAAASSMEMSRF